MGVGQRKIVLEGEGIFRYLLGPMQLKTRELKVDGYEKVVACEEASTGLNAIIAIHNSNLGPACGGVRLLPYSTFNEATDDVLRLSKGMSYKSSLAGIGFGGGKSVIILDPTKKSKPIFEAFGEFVQSLNGLYIAAKDMNIDSDDLRIVKTKTKHVLGIEGDKGSGGDPSPVTARGAFQAFKATAEEVFGSQNLKGLKLAIQGIGHVGYAFAELAKQAGCELTVTDISETQLKKAEKELGAKVVGPDEIYQVACDVFSPNARGAILNEKTIPQLKCKAVCGSANNQLLTPQNGMQLFERGILYAPDYAVNAGGIINIFSEYEGYDQKRAFAMADKIYGTMKEIFKRSKLQKKAPFIIADELAEERIYGGK